MGRIKELVVNDIGEVTGATVIKGNREVIKRHASRIIPLLRLSEVDNDTSLPPTGVEVIPDAEGTIDTDTDTGNRSQSLRARPSRVAAVESAARTKAMLRQKLRCHDP